MVAPHLPYLESSAGPSPRPLPGQRLAPTVSTRSPRPWRAPRLGSGLFAAATLATLAGGWLLRSRTPLTPESGLGYGLGVAGGTATLLLLLYSARKRLRVMRGCGPLSHWFRIHMMLGVLAPLLILFHCNFRFGAPNSNVALVSMLVVAGSGVVGRYIYTHISHGLYGARATSNELHAELEASAQALGEELPSGSRASRRLAAFTGMIRTPGRLGFVRRLALPFQAISVRRQALRELHDDLADESATRNCVPDARRKDEAAARARVNRYVAALVKEAQFGAYERLFSLWHALHVPLMIMLLLTGIVHVVAVHMY